jgi:DNA adenine methylase
MKADPLILEIRPDRLAVRRRGTARRVLHEQRLSRPAVQPILKWAGGKQWLAPAAPYLAPTAWTGGYYEPFVGGAAFFFALEPGRATLSDRNAELIRTYRALRDDTAGVVKLLCRYPFDSDFYYRMRNRTPVSRRAHAARFIYLNRTCWNGLYRTNSDGRFNTPIGRFVYPPTVCDTPRLLLAAELLGRPTLRAGDFQTVTVDARAGDFVYFDPPYITGHQNNGFLKYNAQLFSWADQQRLATHARRLATKGVHVLVSNADHDTVLALYHGFHFYRTLRRSLISGSSDSRGTVSEALLSSYPLLGFESEVVEQ